MTIEIKALDTLFFKDAKPFNWGENSWADGIFPPPPSAFYGMLRTFYGMRHGLSLQEMVRQTESLKINQIAFGKINDAAKVSFWPFPYDCVADGKEKGIAQRLLAPQPLSQVSNYGATHFLQAPERTKALSTSQLYLETNNLDRYLAYYSPEVAYQEIKVEEEPKIGIGMDNATRTVEEGKLFRVGMKRANKLCFLIDFEGIDLPLDKATVAKLGAEGKHVSISQAQLERPEFPEFDGNRFVVYLSTPAFFASGSLPTQLESRLDAKIIACAMGKPQSLGGFDMLLRAPKVMRRAVPAGSVFYFEANGALDLERLKALHGTSISDFHPEQGFGIAFVGNVKPA